MDMDHVGDYANGDQHRKRPAKLFHKKTRTGCQRCRSRRVKCDEGRPICANCTRLQLDCFYSSGRAPSSEGSSPHDSRGDALSDYQAVIPPESEARRKLELDLFYAYVSTTGPSIALDERTKPFWGPVTCNMALKSDAVLYSVCLVAALHRALRSGYTDTVSMEHCSKYLQMTLHEHSKEIATLDVDNIDSAAVTSSMLRIYSFAHLQRRELEPYRPPMEWLRMTGSTNIIFRKGWNIARDNPNSITVNMLATSFHILAEDDDRQYTECMIHLLKRQRPHELLEPWDADTEDAYMSTINYIGAMWSAEMPTDAGRRLTIFPMVVDKRFVALVDEMRPRALVIMAHYFALLVNLREFWPVGDAGRRECRAIASMLPMEWLSMMREPLSMLDRAGQ